MIFEDLIHPITDHVFQETILGKKPIVIRADAYKRYFFSNICSWDDISKYVSNDRAAAGLQMITPDGKKIVYGKGKPLSWTEKLMV